MFTQKEGERRRERERGVGLDIVFNAHAQQGTTFYQCLEFNVTHLSSVKGLNPTE
jgi:hypothetical protein